MNDRMDLWSDRRETSSLSAAKHKHNAYQRRADASPGAEKLNNIYRSIRGEIRTLHHAIESRQPND